MFTRFSARAGHSTPGAAADRPPRSQAPDDAVAWIKHAATAERACCCPSRPVAVAVFPPQPGRPRPVDLLLCGHHYRESRAALAAAGATIYHLPRQQRPRQR
jgi:hypothetical protein